TRPETGAPAQFARCDPRRQRRVSADWRRRFLQSSVRLVGLMLGMANRVGTHLARPRPELLRFSLGIWQPSQSPAACRELLQVLLVSLGSVAERRLPWSLFPFATGVMRF